MNIRMLTTEERERLAYVEGYTEAAELLAQLADAEHELEATQDKLFDVQQELDAIGERE
jgi:hypothetical protein